nr:helix-turn-helix domain-containing protein [Chloroflexota bacterium]
MSLATKKEPRKRKRSVASIAPALALLAQGQHATQVASTVGVSTTTILNWMDWAWKHRQELDAYLDKHYPDLTKEQVAGLWERIARRRIKRERRLDFESLLLPE